MTCGFIIQEITFLSWSTCWTTCRYRQDRETAQFIGSTTSHSW